MGMPYTTWLVTYMGTEQHRIDLAHDEYGNTRWFIWKDETITPFEQSFGVFYPITFSLTKFLYIPKCENVTPNENFLTLSTLLLDFFEKCKAAWIYRIRYLYLFQIFGKSHWYKGNTEVQQCTSLFIVWSVEFLFISHYK